MGRALQRTSKSYRTPKHRTHINASKTNVMSALIPGEQCQATLLDDEPLEDVEKFQYIGSIFVANGLLHLAFFQGSIKINEYFLPN